MGCVFMGGGTRFVNGAGKKKSVLWAGFAAAFLMVCGAYAQTKNVKPTPPVSTFKDSRDGKTYKKVAVGTQTWMAENLNYAADGSKCYNNDAGNCEKYGRLYNWATAKTACPTGWHLPSDEEWTTLENTVGGRSTAGTKFKSSAGWNKDGNGTDEYAFSAMPGGHGNSDGSFATAGSYGNWWSASMRDVVVVYFRSMSYNYKDVYRYYDVGVLFSVRCVQD